MNRSQPKILPHGTNTAVIKEAFRQRAIGGDVAIGLIRRSKVNRSQPRILPHGTKAEVIKEAFRQGLLEGGGGGLRKIRRKN